MSARRAKRRAAERPQPYWPPRSPSVEPGEHERGPGSKFTLPGQFPGPGEQLIARVIQHRGGLAVTSVTVDSPLEFVDHRVESRGVGRGSTMPGVRPATPLRAACFSGRELRVGPWRTPATRDTLRLDANNGAADILKVHTVDQQRAGSSPGTSDGAARPQLTAVAAGCQRGQRGPRLCGRPGTGPGRPRGTCLGVT